MILLTKTIAELADMNRSYHKSNVNNHISESLQELHKYKYKILIRLAGEWVTKWEVLLELKGDLVDVCIPRAYFSPLHLTMASHHLQIGIQCYVKSKLQN